jgi:hypothetical protein
MHLAQKPVELHLSNVGASIRDDHELEDVLFVRPLKRIAPLSIKMGRLSAALP